jgi:hypothetical protein
VELVAKTLDGDPPLREGAVEVIRGTTALHWVLTYRRESLGAKRAPDLDLEARHRRMLVAAVGEDRAEPRRARASLASDRIEATRDRHRGRDPSMERVLDDGGEVFVVEHAGEIDDGASRTGQRDGPETALVVQRNRAVVDDHEVGLQRTRCPDLWFRRNDSVEVQERACPQETGD